MKYTIAITILVTACITTGTIILARKVDAQSVNATQVPYIPDVANTPTAEQYNGLLHALQNAHLMQGAPSPPPKSDWLHWWPFP